MTIAIEFKSVNKSYRLNKSRPFLAGTFLQKLLMKPAEKTTHVVIPDIIFK